MGILETLTYFVILVKWNKIALRPRSVREGRARLSLPLLYPSPTPKPAISQMGGIRVRRRRH